MAKVVWGMDIGNTAIKVVKVRRSGAGVEVVDFDIEEIQFDEDDSTRSQRVREALARLVARRPLGADPVYVSIPGNHTLFRTFTLPEVEDKRVAEIVQYEARQQIPFRLEEVLWGYKYHRTDNGEMQISLVAVRREVVEDLLEMAKAAGLNVEGVVSAPLALYNFVMFEFRPDVTSIVLDGGARVTDFVVVDGDSFWMRPIPAGSAEMVRTLRQKFRISQEEAENLLVKMDQSKQSEKMFQVIEPIIRNLAGDIQRSLGFYKSLSRNVRVERVIGLGGAFKIPQVREYVGRSLGQELETPSTLENFHVAPGLDVGWLEEEAPSLAVALGLAVQGLGLAPTDVNLLPEEVQKEKLVSRKKPWAVVSVLVFIMAVALSYTATKDLFAAYNDAITQAKGLKRRVIKYRDDFTAASDGIEKEEKRLEYYSRIARERPWFLDCLNKTMRTLLEVSPRKPLTDKEQPRLYARQIFMSRYDISVMRKPEEEERRAGANPFGPRPRPVMPVAASPRPAAGQAATEDTGVFRPDPPMMVVFVGEVMGWKQGPPPPPGEKDTRKYTVSIDPAFPLRDALGKVKEFEKPDFRGTWREVEVVAMSRKDYREELKKAKEENREPVITKRKDLVFTLVWRYDDGTDIRKK